MQLVKTSKGVFPIHPVGSGTGYKVKAINECAIGFFILLEDGSRDYFNQVEDIIAIREAYKGNIK